MATHTALNIVQNYYQCFNNKDWNGMLALVDDSIRHEPNEGEVRIGKLLFKEFLHKMDTSYEEKLTDLVFFTEPSGKRIAAEFTVNGTYKKGDNGLPEAHGQTYNLQAGAFLEVDQNRITRITTYYNLSKWVVMVSE